MSHTDHIKEIAERLAPPHYYCEDRYYSCPLAEDSCYNDQKDPTKCDCGRDEKVKEIIEALTTAYEKGKEEALKNVPVGFVRQWINEDLLKVEHRLVTDDDIQAFINVALKNKQS